MNTFNILNKAVMDENLSSTGFRLLYYFVNLANLHNTTELNIYNSVVAEFLHISNTQVSRITNELVETGYIHKTVYKHSQNNQPNKYTIIEQL